MHLLPEQFSRLFITGFPDGFKVGGIAACRLIFVAFVQRAFRVVVSKCLKRILDSVIGRGIGNKPAVPGIEKFFILRNYRTVFKCDIIRDIQLMAVPEVS